MEDSASSTSDRSQSCPQAQGQVDAQRHTNAQASGQIDTNAQVAAFLTSAQAESIVAASLESLGWLLIDYTPDKPFLRPGAGVSVGYFVTARATDRDFSTYLIASTEKVDASHAVLTFTDPEGVITDPIYVWQFPHDPSLPALPEATHPQHMANQLGIEGLGANVVVYRPTRRAVIEYKVGEESVAFGKVVHPATGAELVRRTNAVAQGAAPFPRIIYATEGGLVVSEAARGRSFANEIAFRPDEAKAKIADFERVLDSLGPAVAALDEHASWAKRIHHYAKTAREILPEYVADIDRITELVTHVLSLDIGGPDVATHGDFFEANVLIDDDGRLTLIDLDHVGPGKRNDDWGCLLAHVSVLPFLTENEWVVADPSEPYRERLEMLNPGGMRCSFYPRSEEVLEAWCQYLEQRTNPYDLYARTTAVALSMASNSDVGAAPREAHARMRRVLWWEERTRSWAPSARINPR
ncbi:phosphotransferase [Trueperella bialowiezensis]|uniref:Phosphotransferase enzyme family n=1 Tax=Trueperella bialowiezensis TaxID=312285 RepID=A0A3S4YX39_9ACTO|nr:phosphotransferase [Trueperella bialowiezensis]VEI12748.1 Phosphotransferase enzyme family [Trueperella bialowiezensis]